MKDEIGSEVPGGTVTFLVTFSGTGYAVGTNQAATNFSGSTPFSACAWLKPSTTAQMGIVSTLDSTNNFIGWEMELSTGNDPEIFLVNSYSGNAIEVHGTGAVLTAGNLGQECFTYDGSKTAAGVLIYVNGNLTTTSPLFNSLTGSIANTIPVHVIPVHGETNFDHSIFGLLKRVASQVDAGGPSLNALSRMASIYLAATACVGFFLFFGYIRTLPLINQVLSLCIISILFPPISFDYTLMHLYVPWALLALWAIHSAGRRRPGLRAAFVCFAVLMAPETEFIWNGISYNGQIKALFLIALLAISIRYPFHDSPPSVVSV